MTSSELKQESNMKRLRKGIDKMKSGYFTRWAKAAGVRAVKTMAQTAAAVIGTASVVSTVDWKLVASSAVVAGVLSVLTSIAGLPEVKTEA